MIKEVRDVVLILVFIAGVLLYREGMKQYDPERHKDILRLSIATLVVIGLLLAVILLSQAEVPPSLPK